MARKCETRVPIAHTLRHGGVDRAPGATHAGVDRAPPATRRCRSRTRRDARGCRSRTSPGGAAWGPPRLVKTASSGSFRFQGPGSHLIGSVQQFWLSIGGCGGRQVGLENIALTASTSSVFPAEVDVGQSAHDTYPTGEMPLSPLPV